MISSTVLYVAYIRSILLLGLILYHIPSSLVQPYIYHEWQTPMYSSTINTVIQFSCSSVAGDRLQKTGYFLSLTLGVGVPMVSNQNKSFFYSFIPSFVHLFNHPSIHSIIRYLVLSFVLSFYRYIVVSLVIFFVLSFILSFFLSNNLSILFPFFLSLFISILLFLFFYISIFFNIFIFFK